LNPKQPRYPECQREAGKNQSATHNGFTYTQPPRSDEFRAVILNPLDGSLDQMGRQEPNDNGDRQPGDGS